MKGDLGSRLMMSYVLGRMQLPSLKNPSYNTPQRTCGLQTGKGGSGHGGGHGGPLKHDEREFDQNVSVS